MNVEFLRGLIVLIVAAIFLATTQVFYKINSNLVSKPADNNSIADLKSKPVIEINERGEELFLANCRACHSLGLHNYFRGLTERVPDRVLLRNFIRNSQQVIESGDKYFVDLYERFNKTAMNKFPDLSDNKIDDIIEYIEQKSKNY